MKKINTSLTDINVALIGARGYVGIELIRLIDNHPKAKLVAAFSREHHGKKISEIIDGLNNTDICYSNTDIHALTSIQPDVVFLALPNSIAKKHEAFWSAQLPNTVIIDLSADFRFDTDWCYGQPETNHTNIRLSRRIANPGCYATGAQLGLRPIKHLLKSTPHIFGVSGYSGAGTTPSNKNNPKYLSNNLISYQPINHIHELEVSSVLQQKVHFMPHVAAFFRGIHLTISVELTDHCSDMYQRFDNYYKDHAFISISHDAPQVANAVGKHTVHIGGFQSHQYRAVWTVTLDNLLKGAATQAIQNMNLALASEYQLKINSGLDHER